jgi:hypothetical protein
VPVEVAIDNSVGDSASDVPQGLASRDDGRWRLGVGHRQHAVLPGESPVKVYWNGSFVGRVGARGRVTFTIHEDGEARFTSPFRSARIDIEASADTTIYLGWDGPGGRLIATRDLGEIRGDVDHGR